MPKELGIDLLKRLIADANPEHCIEWPLTKSSWGYGWVWYEGRSFVASRMAYKLFYGEYPKNQACHTCDNPPCVNPLHLFDGDQVANVRDGWKKGRYPRPKGRWACQPHRIKADPGRIFDLARMGISNTEIARYFSLSQPYISRVLNGKRRFNYAP